MGLKSKGRMYYEPEVRHYFPPMVVDYGIRCWTRFNWRERNKIITEKEADDEAWNIGKNVLVIGLENVVVAAIGVGVVEGIYYLIKN